MVLANNDDRYCSCVLQIGMNGSEKYKWMIIGCRSWTPNPILMKIRLGNVDFSEAEGHKDNSCNSC